jgi:cytochrome c biogenesis protein
MPVGKIPELRCGVNRGGRFAAAVVLLVGIAAVAILGTFPTEFIPKDVPGAWIANALIGLTRFCGGRALYRSPFFILLLACLAVSLIETLVRQFRGFFHSEKIISRPSGVVREVSLEASLEEALKKIRSAAAGCHYQPVSLGQGKESKERFQLTKNGFGVWGPLGVHLGVLIVLLGGLVTFLTGEVKEVQVREGETLYLDHEKINLRLDKFSVIPYPGKEQTQEYLSRFTIKDGKGERQRLDLRVNHPLKIGLTKIFQMRYRVEAPRLELLLYQEGKPVRTAMLEAKNELKMPDTGLTLRYEEVIPNFRITRGGEVFSMSAHFINPAVRLYVNGKPRWVFGEVLKKHRSADNPWDFSIQKIHKVYSSGLRVSRDPGIGFAFFGFVVLVFGSFLSSFAIPRVIGVNVEFQGQGCRIFFEGLSVRDPAGIAEEIDRLMSQIGNKGAGI